MWRDMSLHLIIQLVLNVTYLFAVCGALVLACMGNSCVDKMMSLSLGKLIIVRGVSAS